MKAVILAVHLTIFFRSAYLSDQELDDPQGEEERLPHYLKDDGIRRVAKLDKLHFNKTLKASRMLVVLFYISNSGDKKLDNTWKTDEKMLEIVARVLQPQGVNIGSVNIAESLELSQNLGVKYSGAIMIFHRGKRIEYFGHRSADILLGFLHKMFEPPVSLIESKKQKAAFDDVEGSKVIGYFEKDSEELKAFEDEAKQQQPLLPFFAVWDKKLAKALRLKKPNSIQLLKPYEKPKYFNEGQIGRYSLYLVKGFLIMAFVRLETNAGVEFFSLVKSLAKRYGNKKNLHFIWVDPDPFPTMRDYWQRSYNIDVNSPAIGVIEPKLSTSSWFEKKGKETKLRHLQQWVEDILAGKVELKAPQNSTESSQGEHKMEQIMKEEL
ncbi:Calsequestrin-1 [Acropora cervicornis]|uniref:Calsequestrin n=1 Tax=Acropora cervicornis TaxID=6130 RepID=A0AAD9R6B3_ACRCE|nr:Calsequestrin-1 [Acropora cervicornis]